MTWRGSFKITARCLQVTEMDSNINKEVRDNISKFLKKSWSRVLMFITDEYRTALLLTSKYAQIASSPTITTKWKGVSEIWFEAGIMHCSSSW